jgi:hypothetical protein
MNHKQKSVLIIIAIIIGLMILFPPYVAKNYKQVVIKSGYAFIFNFPPYVSTKSDVMIPSTINASTLFIQIIALLIIGSLVFAVLKTEKNK